MSTNQSRKQKPHTPSQRYYHSNTMDISPNDPERRLTSFSHRKKGRNAYGRITSRRRGGGHKKLYRTIDFKRTKMDIPATIQSIEYDPFRSANIALLAYADGEKRYIIAPNKLKVGDKVFNTNSPVEDYNIGLNIQLKHLPPATIIHAIELQPGKGAQLARGAGASAQLVSVEKGLATIKLPSGEIRKVHEECRATIGEVGNNTHNSRVLGKAGRNRWLGKRPRVRGVAMNPVDHPMGGGEGRTSGGGHPVSPWGQLSKGGFATRKRSKTSNKLIVVRRNGKKVKRK